MRKMLRAILVTFAALVLCVGCSKMDDSGQAAGGEKAAPPRLPRFPGPPRPPRLRQTPTTAMSLGFQAHGRGDSTAHEASP